MYKALYRTYRPETFDEVIGQDHVVRILKNQVKKNQVGHAYLFCGTRGTGKTSVARILAKAVNCTGEGEKPCGVCPNCLSIKNGNFIDVIEIDAASNNGIDSAREIRESINYPPSVGRKKVYIIDEAHELTNQALNALLKTLEEPPEDVMFILATTDPQDLLQTILSRCLRLDFHRIPDGKLREHMAAICNERGVEITEDALDLLASNADGSARDALSLLDQCLAGVDTVLDRDAVIEYLGTASTEFFLDLTDDVLSGDTSSALVRLDGILREGKDVKQILVDWMSHYRSLLISRYLDDPESVLNMSMENVKKLVEQASKAPIEVINSSIMTLAETARDSRFSPQPRVLMELAIVTLAGGEVDYKPMPKKTAPEPSSKPNAKPNAKPDVKPTVKPDDKPNEKPKPEVEPDPSSKSDVKVRSSEYSEYDLEDIWDKVWDIIDDLGSVTMVRIGSTLAGISQDEFKVLMTSDMAISTAERKRGAIESAMEEILGRPLKMVISKVNNNPGEQQSLFEEMPVEAANNTADNNSDEEVRKNLKEVFNLDDINIKIEE